MSINELIVEKQLEKSEKIKETLNFFFYKYRTVLLNIEPNIQNLCRDSTTLQTNSSSIYQQKMSDSLPKHIIIPTLGSQPLRITNIREVKGGKFEVSLRQTIRAVLKFHDNGELSVNLNGTPCDTSDNEESNISESGKPKSIKREKKEGERTMRELTTIFEAGEDEIPEGVVPLPTRHMDKDKGIIVMTSTDRTSENVKSGSKFNSKKKGENIYPTAAHKHSTLSPEERVDWFRTMCRIFPSKDDTPSWEVFPLGKIEKNKNGEDVRVFVKLSLKENTKSEKGPLVEVEWIIQPEPSRIMRNSKSRSKNSDRIVTGKDFWTTYCNCIGRTPSPSETNKVFDVVRMFLYEHDENGKIKTYNVPLSKVIMWTVRQFAIPVALGGAEKQAQESDSEEEEKTHKHRKAEGEKKKIKLPEETKESKKRERDSVEKKHKHKKAEGKSKKSKVSDQSESD
jgi:hypothetical protein